MHHNYDSVRIGHLDNVGGELFPAILLQSTQSTRSVYKKGYLELSLLVQSSGFPVLLSAVDGVLLPGNPFYNYTRIEN